jgi:hypothetical protein
MHLDQPLTSYLYLVVVEVELVLVPAAVLAVLPGGKWFLYQYQYLGLLYQSLLDLVEVEVIVAVLVIMVGTVILDLVQNHFILLQRVVVAEEEILLLMVNLVDLVVVVTMMHHMDRGLNHHTIQENLGLLTTEILEVMVGLRQNGNQVQVVVQEVLLEMAVQTVEDLLVQDKNFLHSLFPFICQHQIHIDQE